MNKPNDKENPASGVASSGLLDAAEVAQKFKRYRDIRADQEDLVMRRGYRFGLHVHQDELALKYQKHLREVEELEAFFEGRDPIPERWEVSSVNTRRS